ncbi:MAG: cation:proton antiporter [Prolixibacteraceae bacterium]
MNTYFLIIALSIIIVFSFLFNLLAKRTNFPSVLLLIALGIGVKVVMSYLEVELDFFPILEALGVIGLIMIVLEAALDLELKKEKRALIIKSMIVAFLGLIISSLLISWIIQAVLPNVDFLNSLIYAIPMSIMSSAIIIPSVINLNEENREFMVYESTFSDIFGIMFFYYVLGNVNAHGFSEIAVNVSMNLLTTIGISLLLGYIMVWALQSLKTRTKFFLILAILILLYAIGKLIHISSLLIILIFGLILNNRKVFFRGKLSSLISRSGTVRLLDDFKLFTAETSFLVRTFFFVFFGMSLSLDTFAGSQVWVISFLILAALFGIRIVLFKAVLRKNIFPRVWLAPRGLITILLFYAIPEEFHLEEFKGGVLFIIIIVTAVIMAISLMMAKKHNAELEQMEKNLPLEQ